jgi:arabinofuranosyltransferase
MNNCNSSKLVAITTIIIIGILNLHATWYLPFIQDDAFISFRYAERLAYLGELNWNDNEFVEGYTNFLWVILLAIGAKLGIPLVEASRIIGLFSMSAVVAITICYSISISNKIFSGALAGLFWSCSGIVAAWSMGGLEQPLIALLLAILIYQIIEFNKNNSRSTLIYAGISGGLLAITRPDGILFPGICGIWLLFRQKLNLSSIKRGILFGAIPLLFFGLHILFRIYYYNDIVPNTAHVKLPFSINYLTQGLRYVQRGYMLHFPLLIPLVVIVFTSIKPPRITLLVMLLTSWTIYLILIGGDVNPPSRHFVPVLVILIFILIEFLVKFSDKLRDNLIPSIGLFIFYILLQLVEQELREARNPKDFSNFAGAEVGKIFKKGFGNKAPLIAVDGAGAVPFYSQLPSIDMLGLNDRYIALNPPSDFGNGWLGHELGDPKYILKRKPALILFGSYKGKWNGAYTSGKKLIKEVGFKENYQKASITGVTISDFVIKIWVRRKGVLGVKKISNKVFYPPYLLNPKGNIVAEYTSKNSFITKLTPKDKIILKLFDVNKFKIKISGCILRKFNFVEKNLLQIKVKHNCYTSGVKLIYENKH